MASEAEQLQTAPQTTDSTESSTNKATKVKEEKKKHPKLRKEIFEHYGVSVRDHFIRDTLSKYHLNEDHLSFDDFDLLFQDAINQTLTGIAEPFLNVDLFTHKSGFEHVRNSTKINGKCLLQVFTARDISKAQHKVDALNTGSDRKRCLHFILTDGKTKVNAIEYQHVAILDNLPICPGTKVQLENVEIRNGVLLLRPSNVTWIGGEVASFTAKFVAAVKARDAESRVHHKNLLKGETPPPRFEDDRKPKVAGNDNDNTYAYDVYYDDYERYEQEQQQQYDDDGVEYKDEYFYEEPEAQSQPQSQSQLQSQPQSQSQPQPQSYVEPQPQSHVQSHVQPQVHVQQQSHMQPQVQSHDYAYEHAYNASRVDAGASAVPRTLQELYCVGNLPYISDINAKIIAAALQINRATNEAYIEFTISDVTGTCKAMTSTYLMQWIVSQYGNEISQRMVDIFFSKWGQKTIQIKMELKDPQEMVIFHEIRLV